jgi:hypothetical protein
MLAALWCKIGREEAVITYLIIGVKMNWNGELDTYQS